MASTTGRIFSVTTFGESHGPMIGAVVDGCPARLKLSGDDINRQLARRRPGQSRLSTPRKEDDSVQIVSGVENGVTLGTPITLLVKNRDTRPGDYAEMQNVPRPSHADFTYRAKYGIASASGGGRASARETAARVAAGGVAEKYLSVTHGVEIVAWVSAVGGVECLDVSGDTITREDVDLSEIRCPDSAAAAEMAAAVEDAMRSGDSFGGVVTCVCRNVPAGWGEPVFDKAEALLGAAMLSIPAARGFEIGSGFAGARMKGSGHNDMFVMKNGRMGTVTNRSGGVQGGITNGEPVVLKVAFKPPATIALEQKTVDYDGNAALLKAGGRHDPCVLPRAVPIVESMAAIVLADLALTAGK